jgi:predicted DsbA family dithiol-disulfide isomerase
MTRTINIDFVSDVSCPWCAIGLGYLDVALERLRGVVRAEIIFQPFELNPGLPPEGEDRYENVARKYGTDRARARANRERQRVLAAQVGFEMVTAEDSRFYNTFDAHRLLWWARIEGRQAALKRALLAAFHTHMRDVSDHEVLVTAATYVGLDPDAAREVLFSGRYADEVRAAERGWLQAGVTGVPVVVVDGRRGITGAQPPDTLEHLLRQALAEPA